jgi:hypothetical protein
LEAIANAVGYAGAAVIVVAYFLNQRGTLPAEDWRFPALNLLGACAMLVSLAVQPNLPSVVIELFWAAISLYGLWRSRRATRR